MYILHTLHMLETPMCALHTVCVFVIVHVHRIHHSYLFTLLDGILLQLKHEKDRMHATTCMYVRILYITPRTTSTIHTFTVYILCCVHIPIKYTLVYMYSVLAIYRRGHYNANIEATQVSPLLSQMLSSVSVPLTCTWSSSAGGWFWGIISVLSLLIRG